MFPIIVALVLQSRFTRCAKLDIYMHLILHSSPCLVFIFRKGLKENKEIYIKTSCGQFQTILIIVSHFVQGNHFYSLHFKALLWGLIESKLFRVINFIDFYHCKRINTLHTLNKDINSTMHKSYSIYDTPVTHYASYRL